MNPNNEALLDMYYHYFNSAFSIPDLEIYQVINNDFCILLVPSFIGKGKDTGYEESILIHIQQYGHFKILGPKN